MIWNLSIYSTYDLFKRSVMLTAPREIIFEINSVYRMHEYLRGLGVDQGYNIAIIMDPVIKSHENIRRMIKNLEENKYSVEISTDIEYEPTISTAERLVEFVRRIKPRAVIGIGGGSTLDLAKVTTVGLDNIDKSVRDFIGVEKIPKRITPLILTPTTAGTGSEVSRFAILSENGKKAISSRFIIPDIALVDPVLTYTMPPRTTAGSGLDALSHAVEAMISLRASPFSDLLSLQSIEWIFRYLLRAYYNGKDEEARYFMSLAATTAGIPLTVSGMVLGHSIAQTFGPRYKIHHGVSCGMTLPYILEFYLPVMIDKYNIIADVIGIKKDLDKYSRATEVIRSVWRLVEALDIPLSLKEIGVSKAELEKLAEATLIEWPRPNSPIELTKERVLKVYQLMYEGTLGKVKIS